MGIPGLWKETKAAATRVRLPDYCDSLTVKKSTPDSESSKLPVIGIDASIWMHRCQFTFIGKGKGRGTHAQMGENPELRTLFLWLCWLLQICVRVVFVFDGPNRPARKRGVNIITVPHWLENRFKDFIRAFRFHIHQAPGEAEAELAHMSRIGEVDIVYTIDSDALVFGACCVVKSLTSQADKSSTHKQRNHELEEVEVYTATRLRTKNGVQLSEGGLLLMALLIGGDYDDGVEGCGEVIAHGLALTGLGDSLRNAFLQMSPADFQEFREQWRNDLITELRTNQYQHLTHRHPTIANNIREDFPSTDTIRLYVRPAVTPANDIHSQYWVSRNVDVGTLVELCEASFSWRSAAGIAKAFRKNLFAGIALRQLIAFDVEGISNTSSDTALIPPALFCQKRRASMTGLRTSRRYIVTAYINQIQEQIPGFLQDKRNRQPPIPDDIKLHFVDFHAPMFLIDPIQSHINKKTFKMVTNPSTSARNSSHRSSSEAASASSADSDATPPASILPVAEASGSKARGATGSSSEMRATGSSDVIDLTGSD